MLNELIIDFIYMFAAVKKQFATTVIFFIRCSYLFLSRHTHVFDESLFLLFG